MNNLYLENIYNVRVVTFLIIGKKSNLQHIWTKEVNFFKPFK